MAGFLIVCSSSLATAKPQGVTNTGTSGLFATPTARTLTPGTFVVGTELGVGRTQGHNSLGPGPLVIGIGVPTGIDLSFSMRDSGLPRDQPKDIAILRAGLKIALFEGSPTTPMIAVETFGDHLATTVVPGFRLVASSWHESDVMATVSAGYHGARLRRHAGPEISVGFAFEAQKNWHLLSDVTVEGTRTWGVLLNAGARYKMLPWSTLSLALRWGPIGPGGIRIVLGLEVNADGKFASNRRGNANRGDVPVRQKHFSTPVPKFRMRVHMVEMATSSVYRPLHPEFSDQQETLDLEHQVPPAELSEPPRHVPEKEVSRTTAEEGESPAPGSHTASPASSP